MFLPTSRKEMQRLGWDTLDVILVTGDAYIDSPFIGVAVIGKVLVDAGYRVGIIAQPDHLSADDITSLGEPELFWGVTGGSIDSMVANRTASGKKRRSDDYTPGGVNNRRPDRAVLVYTNLIRSHFKNTCPVVVGGIEASLRRVAHYDYWSNKIRRSILFDAKADYLLYGMAERSVLELADALQKRGDPRSILGFCYASSQLPADCLELPSFEEAAKDKKKFTEMFQLFYRNNDAVTAKTIAQQQDSRYLVQNPPAPPLDQQELDRVHGMDFERDAHPGCLQLGKVKALETIRFSIATHRGCYGECNFCAIAVHQGRTVTWRSRDSIVAEARRIAVHPQFKGTIHDVGGPTANMYGFECSKKIEQGSCLKKRCLFPKICPQMTIDHGEQIKLLQELRKIKNVRKIFVASGIRYDMILADRKNGLNYLRELVRHHISGQMKVAPEHSEAGVLACMGKPGVEDLLEFRKLFMQINKKEKKKQFLTYYMIAAHPGCNQSDMNRLKKFCTTELKLLPRQVQVFTPTPSTYSTLMYWTGINPVTEKPCFVEQTVAGREKQKQVISKTGSGKQAPSSGKWKRKKHR